MPQSASKALDNWTVVAQSRGRDERMMPLPPNRRRTGAAFFGVQEYSARVDPPLTDDQGMENDGLFAPAFNPMFARARARPPTERRIPPMLMDQNVMAYVRNQASTPPMQTEMGRQGAAAAQQLLNR